MKLLKTQKISCQGILAKHYKLLVALQYFYGQKNTNLSNVKPHTQQLLVSNHKISEILKGHNTCISHQLLALLNH